MLLVPREVARLFGVRTTTLARWAREGRLTFARTPGGHRRYRHGDIRKLLSETQGQDFNREQMEVDAVRLYEQGWSIRRVAKEFGVSYGVVRRILMKKNDAERSKRNAELETGTTRTPHPSWRTSEGPVGKPHL
jgi:excisionase family DNA binding protein